MEGTGVDSRKRLTSFENFVEPIGVTHFLELYAITTVEMTSSLRPGLASWMPSGPYESLQAVPGSGSVGRRSVPATASKGTSQLDKDRQKQITLNNWTDMDNSGTRLRTPFAHSLPLPLPLPLPSPALSWPGVMTPGGTPRPGPPSEMDAAIFAHGRKRRRAYKELAVLGQGSEATVKLARALETGELCALKVMTKPAGPERAKAECDMRRRFAAVQPLSAAHRHLPRYHELIESEHKWYFAMEHCPGGDLAGYVAARGGRIPESDAARVVAKLLDLLTTLHAHGIVHRDIKPSNVLLRDANDLDSLCLADFANCHVDLRFAVEGGIATPPAEQTKRLETVERNPFNTLHALSPITSEASLSGSTAYDGSPDPLPDEPECGDIGDTLGAAPMKTVTGWVQTRNVVFKPCLTFLFHRLSSCHCDLEPHSSCPPKSSKASHIPRKSTCGPSARSHTNSFSAEPRSKTPVPLPNSTPESPKDNSISRTESSATPPNLLWTHCWTRTRNRGLVRGRR